MNKTFFNPHVGFPCDMCNLVAKSKAGLQVHIKAKHKNEKAVNVPLVPVVEEVINIETEIWETFKCDECDFVSEKEVDLSTHIYEKHSNEKVLEINEIKLEVFAIVNSENDVLEARKTIIERLDKQKEVIKVEKVFVDKSETFFDVDNVRWNNIDISITSNEKADAWKDSKFLQIIFSKCFLWENFRSFEGLNTREILLRRKEEQLQFEISTRGYLFKFKVVYFWRGF